jgi:hypothetical protein
MATRKTISEYAAVLNPLGFEFDGYNGRGHPKWLHRPSGRCISSPSTPGDQRRALKNMVRNAKMVLRSVGYDC